jgi:hypothetical protein
MKLLRTLAAASASAALIMGQAVAASAHPQHEPSAVSFTGQARSATAKYHSLTVAKKAGYSILADTAGITCIADPQMVPWEFSWHQSLMSKCGRTTLPREPELVTVHRVCTVSSTSSTGPSKLIRRAPQAPRPGGDRPTRATCSSREPTWSGYR